MSELQTLLKQKKEIEEKIKALKGTSINAGRASIRPDQNFSRRWTLCYEKRYMGDCRLYTKSKIVRIAIAESDEKEDVIKVIPEVIKELSELYEKCGGEAQ